MRQATAWRREDGGTKRRGRPALVTAGGPVCGDCGGRMRLVGHGGPSRDAAVYACMRRGCECRVQLPEPPPVDGVAGPGSVRQPRLHPGLPTPPGRRQEPERS